LTDSFDYVVLKVKLEKVDNDLIKELEGIINSKDAVLCKIQKIVPDIQITTIVGNKNLTSIDDILDRDPLDTLQEAFAIKHKVEMNERQVTMLKELVSGIRNEEKE
jgi:exonuclease SbcD